MKLLGFLALAMALALSGCLRDIVEPLPETESVAIQVVDPWGNPVQGAWVRSGASEARTDAFGNASLAAGPGPISVGHSDTTTECVVGGAGHVTVWPLLQSGTASDTLTDPVLHAGLLSTIWQPHELELGAGWVQRLDRIQAQLAWDNTPTSAGDLGIGIGDTSFQYRNSEFQTSYGSFSETWAPAADELRSVLTGETIRIGPSISTGHYAATGIPYDVAWSVQLAREGAWSAPCTG